MCIRDRYVDEEDLDPTFMWHLAFAYGQEERDKEAQHFFELAYPTMKTNICLLYTSPSPRD
ncbi:hypothetical protein JMUB7547_28460 [Staphylococcus aureus]